MMLPIYIRIRGYATVCRLSVYVSVRPYVTFRYRDHIEILGK